LGSRGPAYGTVKADMDQEQVERAIGFIVDQQAKFVTGLQELTAHINRVVAVQETQAGMITNLGLQLGHLAAKVDKLSNKVDQLAEMQRHTDGRLNIVISQVDDLIRRSGNPQ